MVRMEPAKMADFFQNTRESFLWSCKQGIMGSFYVKEAEQIRAALAVLGDFTFFDGGTGQRTGHLSAKREQS